MDTTERVFKLGLDGAMTLGFGRLFRRRLSAPAAFGLGWLIAHSANFLFNGQVFGVLKHFGVVRHTWPEFSDEVEGLRERVAGEPSIVFAAAYGSLARTEWSPTSDLDVRLVRAPGLSAAWRASWFALRERTRALFRRFPLDLLVLDSYGALNSLAERDRPVVLGNANVRVET